MSLELLGWHSGSVVDLLTVGSGFESCFFFPRNFQSLMPGPVVN